MLPITVPITVISLGTLVRGKDAAGKPILVASAKIQLPVPKPVVPGKPAEAPAAPDAIRWQPPVIELIASSPSDFDGLVAGGEYQLAIQRVTPD